jgi:hypothetical protein
VLGGSGRWLFVDEKATQMLEASEYSNCETAITGARKKKTHISAS